MNNIQENFDKIHRAVMELDALISDAQNLASDECEMGVKNPGIQGILFALRELRQRNDKMMEITTRF